MKPILIIGSANADFTIHAQRLPRLGETLPGSGFSVNIGGKGLNQAIAVSRLGGKSVFLGAVGRDAHGDMLLKAMTENGVAFEGKRTATASTGVAMITVVKGDNCILLHAGANGCLGPEDMEAKRALIQAAGALVMQLEIPVETVLAAARIAREAEVPVFLNPAPALPLPDAIYPLVDYLIPNEHEARALSGVEAETEDGCRANIRFFREKGAANVIITRGEKGCAWNEGGGVDFLPALPVRPVDTTSAGDTFIGALCVQLMGGKALEDALRYACRAAAVTVSRPGAAASIPFTEELA